MKLNDSKKLPVFICLVCLLSISSLTHAATHFISMSAEVLPNGQLAFKMDRYVNSDGVHYHYPEEAIIPGPTLFAKEGDTLNVSLTNNTAVNVGINIPALAAKGGEMPPGQTKIFTFIAKKAGTYPYFDNGSQLLGLFGAIVVEKTDGEVQSLIEETGEIATVYQSRLTKEFVLFMVGSTFWGAEIKKGTQTPLWTNPTLGAVKDDVIRFHVLSIGPGHSFHLHAHRWLDETDYVGMGAAPNIIDVKMMPTGSASHTFTVRAGSGAGSGYWQYNCHILSHKQAGMSGKFHVVDPNSGETGSSIAGASPYGTIYNHTGSGAGLITFEVSDEPGSWFRSARADKIFDITGSTQSLEIIPAGSSVHFVMSDTNAAHTLSSLLWPSGADDPIRGDHLAIPFNQTRAHRGGGIVKLDVPGLYIFTCKIHPYMFAAVIVDDPATAGLDLGETVDLAMGANDIPTSSEFVTRLLRTFFIATSQNNWLDYSSVTPWRAKYPNLSVRVANGMAINLKSLLETRYGTEEQLAALFNPITPGVGEVWIDTQFEKTASKTKPGTITVLDATDWTLKRKISLPGINMNNPHHLWSNRDQSVIYQTQWFDTKLTAINREDGTVLQNIQVGNSPSHVMTLPATDDVIVALSGENGLGKIPAGTSRINVMLPTQGPAQTPANPHSHWVSSTGKIVTANSNTGDVGIYDGRFGAFIARYKTGGFLPKDPYPIAIGMGIDKIYVTNFWDHSINVIKYDGTPLTTIMLLSDYDPISPTGPETLMDRDSDGLVSAGMMPVQTPVDPTGRVVVTANAIGTITIVDTSIDKVVAMLPCDPGCHGVSFGAKKGGGYYAYVTSKFSNQLIVVDPDPNGDGSFADATIAGRISLVAGTGVASDDTVSSLAGMGGQGVYAIPNVYDGWVQNLPDSWKANLTAAQLNPTE